MEILNSLKQTMTILPKLDLQERVGHTGYIDFITPEEVTELSMSGIDYYNRPFVVVKGHFELEDNTTKKFLQTFFQRYSDCDTLYMGGGSWSEQLFSTIGGMNVEQLSFLNNLLKLKDINIEEYISEYANGDIENFVYNLKLGYQGELKVKRIYLN